MDYDINLFEEEKVANITNNSKEAASCQTTLNNVPLRSRTMLALTGIQNEQNLEIKRFVSISEATCLLEEHQLDLSDFECALCFRLFYKPVTTPCGHTFCRSCLLASLHFNSLCPLCRNQLETPPKRKYSVNIIILNLLEKHFRQDYERREREEEEAEEAEKDKNQINSEDHSFWTRLHETCAVLLSCT